MGVKSDQISSKMAIEKNRRLVIFLTTFLTFLSKIGPIRIYRKTGPTKSYVLGPRLPPWQIDLIYRIFTFFIDFGVFNISGKTVNKIGIYSTPPPKNGRVKYNTKHQNEMKNMPKPLRL
jgi:hypothetical protein